METGEWVNMVKPLTRHRAVSQPHTRHLLPVFLLAFGPSSLIPSLTNGPRLLISIWMNQPEGQAVSEASKQVLGCKSVGGDSIPELSAELPGESQKEKESARAQERPRAGPFLRPTLPQPTASCPGADPLVPVVHLL